MPTTKIFLLSCLLLTANAGFSQELRGKAKAKKDSIDRMTPGDKRKEINKFNKLDLSKEQLAEIKEIQTSGKKAREEIKKDSILSPEQKKQKMKALHKEQTMKVMQKLTPEQQQRFKDMGQEKLKNKDEEKD